MRKSLELQRKSIYCLGVMKRWFNLRMILILGTILFVLGGTVAYWETRHFSESEYLTFSNQSIQLASAFARSASVWLIRCNDEALEFAANLMLAGSGQYVRIDVENEIICCEIGRSSLR